MASSDIGTAFRAVLELVARIDGRTERARSLAYKVLDHRDGTLDRFLDDVKAVHWRSATHLSFLHKWMKNDLLREAGVETATKRDIEQAESLWLELDEKKTALKELVAKLEKEKEAKDKIKQQAALKNHLNALHKTTAAEDSESRETSGGSKATHDWINDLSIDPSKAPATPEPSNIPPSMDLPGARKLQINNLFSNPNDRQEPVNLNPGPSASRNVLPNLPTPNHKPAPIKKESPEKPVSFAEKPNAGPGKPVIPPFEAAMKKKKAAKRGVAPKGDEVAGGNGKRQKTGGGTGAKGAKNVKK